MQRGVVADMVQTTLATVAQTLADPVMLRDAIIAAIAAEEVKEAVAAAAAHGAQPDGHGDSGLGGSRGLDATDLSSSHLRQRRSIHAFVPQQVRKPVASAPAFSSQDAVLRALMAAATDRIQDALAPPQTAGKAGRHAAGGGNAVSESDMWALEELEAELLQQETQQQARSQATPAAAGDGVAGHIASGVGEPTSRDGDAPDDPSATAALPANAAVPSLAPWAVPGVYPQPPQATTSGVVHARRLVPASAAPAPSVSKCTPALLPPVMRFVLCAPAPAAAALAPIAVTVTPRHVASSKTGGRHGGPILSSAVCPASARLSGGTFTGDYAMSASARAHIVSRAAQSRLAGTVPALTPAQAVGSAAPAPAEWTSTVTPRTPAGGAVTTTSAAPPPGEQASAGAASDGGVAVELTPTLHSFHQLLAAADAAVVAQARRRAGRVSVAVPTLIAEIRARFETQIAASKQRLQASAATSGRSGRPSSAPATRAARISTHDDSSQPPAAGDRLSLVVVAAEEGGEAVEAEQARGMGEGAQVAAQSGGGGAGGSFGLVSQDRTLAVVRTHGAQRASVTAVTFNARRTAELSRSASSLQRSRAASSGAAADSETEPGGMRHAQQFDASGVLLQASGRQRLQVLPRAAVEAIVAQTLQSAAAVAGQQLLQSLTQADAQTAQFMASVARVRSGGGKGGGLPEDGDLPAAEAALLQRMAAEVKRRRGQDTRSELLRMLRCCGARTAGAKGAAAGAGNQHHSAWQQAPRSGPPRPALRRHVSAVLDIGGKRALARSAGEAAPAMLLLLQHFEAHGIAAAAPAAASRCRSGGHASGSSRGGGEAGAVARVNPLAAAGLAARRDRVFFLPKLATGAAAAGAGGAAELDSADRDMNRLFADPEPPAFSLVAAARAATASLRKRDAVLLQPLAASQRPQDGGTPRGVGVGAVRMQQPSMQQQQSPQHVNPLHVMGAASALAAAAVAAAESAVALSFAAGRVAAAAGDVTGLEQGAAAAPSPSLRQLMRQQASAGGRGYSSGSTAAVSAVRRSNGRRLAGRSSRRVMGEAVASTRNVSAAGTSLEAAARAAV
jgi:hypothetical protein